MQSRMATLGQIATSLAHELTQPITVISMSAAIAQSIADEALVPYELRAQIATILAQTERAGEMIRHLRSHGHSDGGPLAAVELGHALSGALSLVGTPLREAGIAVTIELAEGLPPVRARLVQVEQVLVNLMLNARDAMRGTVQGSRRLRIKASLGDTVRLEVGDSGPGISPEVMRRMFEAFYTTKAPGEGTGLGLALCATIMRGFGGTIAVTASSDGAIFTLEFIPYSVGTQLPRIDRPEGRPTSRVD